MYPPVLASLSQVHERGVETDFLLAVLKRALPHRRDVRVILMSATMDAVSFAKYFGGATNFNFGGANASNTSIGGAGGAPQKSPGQLQLESAAVTRAPGCVPVISVPGFVHPVREVYLHDILSITGYRPRLPGVKQYTATTSAAAAASASTAGARGTPPTPSTSTSSAKTVLAGMDDPDASLLDDDEVEVGPEDSTTLEQHSVVDPHVWRKHGLDYGLIASLVLAVAGGRGLSPPTSVSGASGAASTSGDGGAILVFMPGTAEIRRLQREIEKGSTTQELYVLPLHGALSAAEQVSVSSTCVRACVRASVCVVLQCVHVHQTVCCVLASELGSTCGRHAPYFNFNLRTPSAFNVNLRTPQSLVFRPAPHGKRKVVLATNVAETSITIDDVTVVIDALRVKEAGFDPLNNMSKLVEGW